MRRFVLMTALAPMAWGTTYAVTTELLPAGRPLLAATFRALPTGLVLIAATRRLPTGVWWLRAFVLGGLNFTVFFSMLFIAAYRLPGGVAATVGAVQPLIVLGLSAVALREVAERRQVVAGLLGIAGVALLVLDGGARVDATGVVAGVIGAVSMATGTVLVQRWGRPTDAVTFAGWQLAAGGVMLAPLVLAIEGPPSDLTATNLGGYLYLATVGGAIAYTLWFSAIGTLGARRTTFLALLSPVVATGVGLVLGDHLTITQLAGAAIVLTSVVAVQHPRSGTRTGTSTFPCVYQHPLGGVVPGGDVVISSQV